MHFLFNLSRLCRLRRPLDRDTIDSFHDACRAGNVQIVQSMINDNGKVISRAANGRGETPLHVVCMSSNPSLDIVQLIINTGGEATVTAGDYRGQTPLHYMCSDRNPSLDIVQLLINSGGEAAVTTGDYRGRTPLHFMCSNSNPSLDIVELLINNGGEASVTAEDRHGGTPLHFACSSSNPSLDIVQSLIGNGGKATATTANRYGHGSTPLHWACRSSNPSFPVIKILFETGGCSNWNQIATLMIRNEATFQGTPILHLAIAIGAPPNVLRDFIDGFDNCIGVTDSNGRYPLHVAIEAGLSWENGTQKIVEHVDEAGIIGRTDPVTGLFPFMLAAAGEDAYDLNSVYELLRMDPNCCVAQTMSSL